MTTNNSPTNNGAPNGASANDDDSIRDRVREQSDDGGILGRRDEDLHAAGSSFEDDPTDAGLGEPDSTDATPSGQTGGSREDTGPDDGMGPDAPADVAGEDEPVPGIDDEAGADR